jgi:hemoglobin
MDPINLIYAAIGTEEPYYRLVEHFYTGVWADPVLRPIYPDDLAEAKRKLALYLIYRTGGSPAYEQERGHPRMRGRHMPFKIGIKERDAWMANMNAALDKTPEFAPHRADLDAFFEHFATFMINQPA